MLIKEYRIPMPLSVDEYRIAQLYMIQKKSRDESNGTDSRVEILVNEPYKDGPGGSGQYTHKIYHVGSHLPSWLRGILPKTALQVQEEAWNAYPYCRTKFTCPFMEKFSVDIETIYAPDAGRQTNIFKLQGSEARRDIDFMDIVRDDVTDYFEAEDPKLFRSAETGRGPLDNSWLENVDPSSIMCAYKVCRVEFRYWGMQTRVERFIHETALRKTMLRAHRQAWAWQDEWCHLNIDDIRRLEKETEIALRRVGASDESDMEGAATTEQQQQQQEEDELEVATLAATSDEAIADTKSMLEMKLEQARIASVLGAHSPTSSPVINRRLSSFSGSVSSSVGRGSLDIPCRNLNSLTGSAHSLTKGTPTGKLSPSHSMHSKASARDRFRSSLKRNRNSKVNEIEAELIVGNAFSALAASDTDSDEEFYDAKENVSDEEAATFVVADSAMYSATTSSGRRKFYARRRGDVDADGHQTPSDLFDSDELLNTSSDEDDDEDDRSSLSSRRRRAGIAHAIADATHGRGSGGNRGLARSSAAAAAESQTVGGKGLLAASVPVIVEHLAQSPSERRNTGLEYSHQPHIAESVSPASSHDSGDSGGSSKLATLILVFHGGQPLDTDHDYATQQFNVNLFQSKLESVSEAHYGGVTGHFAVRHVSCPQFCSRALHTLDLVDASSQQRLAPQTSGAAGAAGGGLSAPSNNTGVFGTGFLNMIPLMAASQFGYREHVQATVIAANNAYMEFVQSEEGKNFAGDVCIVGDCMGAILAYDALQWTSTMSRDPCDSLSLHSLSAGGSPTLGTPKSSRSRRESCDIGAMMGCDNGLVFQTSHFFALGSPLGLILAHRQLQMPGPAAIGGQVIPDYHGVGNFYNIFYETSPFSSRIEPQLYADLCRVPLHSVSQYRYFPYGDGADTSIAACLKKYPGLLPADTSGSHDLAMALGSHQLRLVRASRGGSGHSRTSQDSMTDKAMVPPNWWGDRRIDYKLYAPDAVDMLPDSAISPILHSSFWESLDLAAFVIRQLMPGTHSDMTVVGRGSTLFVPDQPREKWLSKATSLKLKSVSANHRATDCAISLNSTATVTGKFMYGALDIATLAQEKVDLYMQHDPPRGKWVLLHTELTDKSGKVTFNLPSDPDLGPDIYPLRMVVRGDHTQAECHLAVLPPSTEAVVFSVDGSFAASLSIMGTDPRVHASSVDVVRFWQELNYLIVYVTARPSMQKKRVVSWLAQHNFPHGLIFFSEGLTTDPQGKKAAFLHRLVNEMDVKIHRAYGSSKDKHLYKSLGLHPNEIYVVGKPTPLKLRSSRKRIAEYITEGYAVHLEELSRQTAQRQVNAMMPVRRQLFGLPFSQKRRKATATSSDTASAGASSKLQQQYENAQRSPSKRRSFFRAALSRRPSAKASESDLHPQQRSNNSFQEPRDRSNSDPSSLAAIRAAAVATARQRRLTPPSKEMPLSAAPPITHLLLPSPGTKRCHSVPEGVNVNSEDLGASQETLTFSQSLTGGVAERQHVRAARSPSTGSNRRSHVPRVTDL